jgi:hypothetical protein
LGRDVDEAFHVVDSPEFIGFFRQITLSVMLWGDLSFRSDIADFNHYQEILQRLRDDLIDKVRQPLGYGFQD